VAKGTQTDGGVAKGAHTDGFGKSGVENIPDHVGREDSPEFRRARRTLHRMVKAAGTQWYGPEPVQAHHGGSIWLHDGRGWFMVLNEAGCEWSAQFCADPAKIDKLRQNAARVVAGFPDTLDRLAALGYDGATPLHTPVTDERSLRRFVDSVWNACVPIPAPFHTGTISATTPHAAGEHNYPKPITDIEHFRRDDFVLFVTDPITDAPVAVTPLGFRGSGDGRVRLAWAPGDHPLGRRLARAEHRGQAVILAPGHPLARQAFELQG